MTNLPIPECVLLTNPFNPLGWHTSNDGVRLNVFSHYGTCSYYGSITNGHARQYGGVPTYPNIVANGDRQTKVRLFSCIVNADTFAISISTSLLISVLE